MTNRFIGNNKTVVLKAEPFTTFGAVDGMNPINDVWNEDNTYNSQCAERYIAHSEKTSSLGNLTV
jgi:hypothetical protein